MKSPYHIRRVEIPDIPTFIELRKRMFEEVGFQCTAELARVSDAYFAEAIPSGDFVGFVAETENATVGSVGLSPYTMPPKPNQPDGRFAYVSSMYVCHEHRRKGIARRLMDAVVDAADELGLTWITLHASEMGRPIYEDWGWQAWKEMGLHIPSARGTTHGG